MRRRIRFRLQNGNCPAWHEGPHIRRSPTFLLFPVFYDQGSIQRGTSGPVANFASAAHGMNTERAVEIGRAFEFQYNAQMAEQNTNNLYVEKWVPVFNRQFTELVARIGRLEIST
ncbi:hypothetical protein T11_9802 [Trichinella zimbabwensis]|uniref:Uncharacterized protein n=1 Tax=Trichinella zimbabwensis TaxID=268475 RepID=A0A0V1HR88_9BILA|nr:hypothetical protein T11_9802 [Trichinella zimbabwensis]